MQFDNVENSKEHYRKKNETERKRHYMIESCFILSNNMHHAFELTTAQYILILIIIFDTNLFYFFTAK